MSVPRLACYADSVRSDGRIPCRLCPRRCIIPPRMRGACGTRENAGDRLIANTYAKVAAIALDPMEKKPLYHFHPGRPILSVGALGCNLACRFCQNWEISHPRKNRDDGQWLPPRDLVALLHRHRERQPVGVAYTYSEPLMWYEYVLDASAEVAAAGFVNVLVTNGFLEPGPWQRILRDVHALNIDVKGFDREFYRRVCGGDRDVVLRNVETALEMGKHVEITLLVIPDATDSPDDVAALVRWLADMDPDIPLHISRYFPHYRMTRPATPLATLHRMQEIAMQDLNHVYLGNIPLADGSDTSCVQCGALLLERSGYRVRAVGLDPGGNCRQCGTSANVVFG